jgi:hypothetical protein
VLPIPHRKAVFVGCARDCGRYLRGALANMAAASKLFEQSAFLFVENDSQDDTAAILADFVATHPHARVETLTGLNADYPRRTERLAYARNRYLELIRTSALSSFDYLIVMDLDAINWLPLSMDQVGRAIAFLASRPDHAAVFANQPMHYYDMWAFRHPVQCPGDVWEEAFDYAGVHGVSDEAALDATFRRRIFRIPEQTLPVEVDSAFGGLGIYRLAPVLEHRYVGLREKHYLAKSERRVLDCQVCEHVALHAGIRHRGGRLFILPGLVNAKGLVFDQRPAAFRSLFTERTAVNPDLVRLAGT